MGSAAALFSVLVAFSCLTTQGFAAKNLTCHVCTQLKSISPMNNVTKPIEGEIKAQPGYSENCEAGTGIDSEGECNSCAKFLITMKNPVMGTDITIVTFGRQCWSPEFGDATNSCKDFTPNDKFVKDSVETAPNATLTGKVCTCDTESKCNTGDASTPGAKDSSPLIHASVITMVAALGSVLFCC